MGVLPPIFAVFLKGCISCFGLTAIEVFFLVSGLVVFQMFLEKLSSSDLQGSSGWKDPAGMQGCKQGVGGLRHGLGSFSGGFHVLDGLPRLKREAGTGVRDPLEEIYPFYVAQTLKTVGPTAAYVGYAKRSTKRLQEVLCCFKRWSVSWFSWGQTARLKQRFRMNA